MCPPSDAASAAAGPALPAPPAEKDSLQRIAARLSSPRIDMGLLAALRRFNPVSDGRHNLFEVQQVLLDAGINLSADHRLQPRWALVVHCLAIVRGAHLPRSDTGMRLFDLGLSEARLRQLIEADEPLLSDLLPTLARRLAAAGQALDWWPLANLALALALDNDAPAQARAELARRRIVQGYLRAAAGKASANA